MTKMLFENSIKVCLSTSSIFTDVTLALILLPGVSFYNHTSLYISKVCQERCSSSNIYSISVHLWLLKVISCVSPFLYQYLSATQNDLYRCLSNTYLSHPISFSTFTGILSVLLPTLLNNNCSFKTPSL